MPTFLSIASFEPRIVSYLVSYLVSLIVMWSYHRQVENCKKDYAAIGILYSNGA